MSVWPAEGRVVLSKIFKWYACDFGGERQLLAWLPRYLPETQAAALRGMLEAGASGIRVEYAEYDWGSNAG